MPSPKFHAEVTYPTLVFVNVVSKGEQPVMVLVVKLATGFGRTETTFLMLSEHAPVDEMSVTV